MSDEKTTMSENKEELKNSPPTKKTHTLKKLTSTIFVVGGGRYCVFVDGKEFLSAYLVSADRTQHIAPGGKIKVTEDDVIVIYSWENELKQLYPDIDTVRQNVFLSFVRSGMFNLEIAKDRKEVRKHAFQTAYPYVEEFKKLIGE